MRDDVKVIVGGVPVTAKYASDVSASAYTAVASAVVNIAEALFAG